MQENEILCGLGSRCRKLILQAEQQEEREQVLTEQLHVLCQIHLHKFTQTKPSRQSSLKNFAQYSLVCLPISIHNKTLLKKKKNTAQVFNKNYHICNHPRRNTYPNTLAFHNPCSTKDNHNQKNQNLTVEKFNKIKLSVCFCS